MHSRDLIEQYKDYVQEWRRYFHKHPELSNEEFETTKTLAKELESMFVNRQCINISAQSNGFTRFITVDDTN